MIGRSLISAIASITSRVNSFGTVLTPTMPVGLTAFTASTKVDTGARSWANGFWKSARSLREVTRSPLMSNSALRRLAARISIPSSAMAWVISSAIAGPAGAPAEEQKALVRDLLPGDTQSGENPHQCDAGGALYVIIVGADFVAI